MPPACSRFTKASVTLSMPGRPGPYELSSRTWASAGACCGASAQSPASVHAARIKPAQNRLKEMQSMLARSYLIHCLLQHLVSDIDAEENLTVQGLQKVRLAQAVHHRSFDFGQV